MLACACLFLGAWMVILLVLRGGARAWGRRSVVVVVGVRVEGYAGRMCGSFQCGSFQRWVLRRVDGKRMRLRRAALMVVKARVAVALQR